jgi:hypothetical protein
MKKVISLCLAFALFIILLMLFACTPQQRMRRLISHHPELLHRDTVWRSDTVVTQQVSKDTVFHFRQSDTVVMHEGKLTVKYFYQRDSVYLKGECAPDTVIKQVPVYIDKVAGKTIRVKEILFFVIIAIGFFAFLTGAIFKRL